MRSRGSKLAVRGGLEKGWGGSCQRTADPGDLVTCCDGEGWKMELRCEVEQMEMRGEDGEKHKKQKEVFKKKTFWTNYCYLGVHM